MCRTNTHEHDVLQQIRRRSRAAVGWLDKSLYRSGLRSLSTLTLPDFLIVGAARSGTWWLASRMARHPQVYMARGEQSGEVKYFSKYFHRPLSTYAALFRDAGDRVKGEKSPHYCSLPKSRIRLIHDLMPQLRLVLILRNPIDRAWSEASTALLRNGERRLSEIEPQEVYRVLDRVRLNYSTIVDNWLECFDASQLHICFFDDISHDTESLLRGVFHHIGVDTDIDYGGFGLGEVVNRGAGIEIPNCYYTYLRGAYTGEIHELQRRFGERARLWLDSGSVNERQQ